MADQRTKLVLDHREERGSRPTRRLRRDGIVPGVVYGLGQDAQPFKVDARRLRTVLVEGHALFDVEFDGGKSEPVIIKDQQRDPIHGRVVHLDLLRVRLDEKIQSMVPLELDGGDDAPGVKEGGVLEHVTREVLIEALPTDIPDRIVANVSGLGVAETMTLSSLTPPGGVAFIGEVEEIVVATVTAPSQVIEEPEVEEEAALVGEEGAEAPEGEAPAEEGAAEGGEAPAEGGSES